MQVTVSHRLFEETTLQAAPGEVIGIVGRNGSGKTTLLHQLHSLIKDSAIVTQESENESIDFSSEMLSLLSEWSVPDFPYENLSGGEQLKVRLTKALASRATTILLDEPTNHLDEESAAKLAQLIRNSPKTWIIVSHDRFFLDETASVIWAIDEGKIDVVEGNYSHYAEWRKAKRMNQMHAYSVQQQQIRKVEQQLQELQAWSAKIHKDSTASHHPKALGAKEYYRTKAKRADKQVKSKRKKLEQQLEKERVDKVAADQIIHFSLPVEQLTGKRILEIKDVAVSSVLHHVNLSMIRGEKVALLGSNGAGKSTLMNAIHSGVVSSGELWVSEAASIGYLSQSVYDLPLAKSISEFFTYENFEEEGAIRTQLDLLGFSREHWDTRIADLSMGERIKLKMAQFILEGRDLLLLDEPTNHLDLPSREQLEEALSSYPGTLLFISHDRYFRERIASRSMLVKDGTLCYPPSSETGRDELLALETEKQAVLGKLSFMTPDHPEYAELDRQFNELLMQIRVLKDQ